MNQMSFTQHVRMPVPKRRVPNRSRAWIPLAFALLAAPALHADPGDLDTSFNGGAFDIAPTPPSWGYAMALQQDGRMLLGGQVQTTTNSAWTAWALARRKSDGTLDDTFGGGTGRVVTKIGYIDSNGHSSGVLTGVAIQSDERILGVGWADSTVGGGTNAFVARWNSDGTLDGSFGTGGKVENFLSYSSDAHGVVLQQDGKPVVVATLRHPSPPYEPVVIRYTTSGVLDPTFGTGGVFRMPASVPASLLNLAWSITMQPDGKILVGTGGYANQHPEVLRLTSNGVLDASFGAGGIAVLPMNTPLAEGGGVAGLTVQPDHKIAGIAQVLEGGGWVFRLNENGTIDTSFRNPNGFAGLGGVTPTSLALIPTGQLLISVDQHLSKTLQLNRYTAAGILDTTFTKSDGTSRQLTYPSPGGGVAVFNSLRLQSDGRFLVGGYDGRYFLAARFLGDALRLRPKDFAFSSVANVALSTVQVSNAVRITSLTLGAYVPIRVFGGRYSVNGDPFTSLLGYVKNGDQVMVEHTSAATAATTATTTLQVGGINSSGSPWIVDGPRVVATFTSTTR